MILSFKENLKMKMKSRFLQEKKRKNKKEELRQELELSNLDRFGEYIDVESKKVLEDVIGLRTEISDAILRPEEFFNETTSFENTVLESKKYQKDKTTINPNALLTMTKILYKRKKERIQWLRVASVCETIYQYLNSNETKEEFLNKLKLNLDVLLELNEFWKTDFIFRSPIERAQYEKN